MTSLLNIAIAALSCLVLSTPSTSCLPMATVAAVPGTVEGAQTGPIFTGQALDVVLTAQSALAWDVTTGTVLYERNAYQPRPVASLSKLLSALVVREALDPDAVITIPPEVAAAQRAGVDVSLPVGHHATVSDLLAASLIASANDAIVTLAIAASSSEHQFVERVNQFALTHNLTQTKLANATGLAGGDQYSTAADVRTLLMMVYQDPLLSPFLAQKKGLLTTREGARRAYTSTNKLLDTYLPVIAAKTGYTAQAGENVALLTTNDSGQRIGLVILGSQQRFQDAKVLAQWIWRNYSWPVRDANAANDIR